MALYTNVKNASFLRDQLMQGNQEFEYALIDASIVRSSKSQVMEVDVDLLC